MPPKDKKTKDKGGKSFDEIRNESEVFRDDGPDDEPDDAKEMAKANQRSWSTTLGGWIDSLYWPGQPDNTSKKEETKGVGGSSQLNASFSRLLSYIPSFTEPDDDDDLDEASYDMAKGGKTLIFNQNFKEPVQIKNEKKFLKSREGTRIDVARIDRLFKWLGFKVQVYEDKTKDEIEKIMLKEASDKENTNISCLVVCILSHGKEGGIYTADGDFMEMRDVSNLFNGVNCPLMVGKPKLFIVQACRGEDVEKLVEFDDAPSENDENGEIKLKSMIASNADQAVFYASTLGTKAWRTSAGSWFIQTLCKKFEKNADKKMLYDIILAINREIAKKGANQMCSLDDNSLTKRLKFLPKMSFEEFCSNYESLDATS